MLLLENLTVSDCILSVLLLQVVPGSEKQIAIDFAKDCDAYIGLGRYDVVLLKEEKGFSFLDEKGSFLRRLRRKIPNTSLDWITMCGIKYKDSGKKDREIKRKDVLGICCLKLAADQETNLLEVEEQVVRQIYSGSENVIVYAGLGYNEIVCVVESESLEDLADKLEKMKRSLVEKESRTKNSILDITTIPCIRIGCLTDNYQIKGDSIATIVLALRACPPSNTFEIAANLLRSNVRSIFGFHDGVISTNLQTAALLDSLLKLREKTRMFGLYSTYTLVELGDAFTSSFHNPETEKQVSLDWELESFKDEALAKMIEEDGEVPEDMVYYYNIFRSLKNDPFTSRLFRNLGPFIKKQIEEFKEAKLLRDRRDYNQKIKEYATVLDSLKLALHQRLTGIEVGNLLGIKSASFDAIGGVHRVIFALESIPLHLLHRLSIVWDGFCVFEHRESIHTCIPSGILMAPRRILLKPDELCSVFHESGHIVFIKLLETDPIFRNSIIEFCDAKSKLKNQHVGVKKESEEEIGKRKALYEEFYKDLSDMFSDMFAYLFGFGSDWKLYSQGLWKRLAERGLVNYKYIARSYITYALMESKLGSIGDAAASEFFSEFEKIATKHNFQVDDQTKSDARKMASLFRDPTGKFASFLKTRFKNANNDDSDLDTIRESLTKGTPVARVDPTRIICAIAETELTPNMRFAAILSLYGEGTRVYDQPISEKVKK